MAETHPGLMAQIIKTAGEMTTAQIKTNPTPSGILYQNNLKVVAASFGIEIDEKAMDEANYYNNVACTFMG